MEATQTAKGHAATSPVMAPEITGQPASDTAPPPQASPASEAQKWASGKEEQQEYSKERVETKKVRTRGWLAFDTVTQVINNFGLNVALSMFMANDRANFELKRAALNDPSKPIVDTNFKQFHGTGNTQLDKYKTKTTVMPEAFYRFSNRIENTSNRIFNHFIYKKQDNEVFGKLTNEKNALGRMPFFSNLFEAFGKYTGGIIFLAWGGHLTNMAMWALERPSIKPKMVRFFDNKVVDPVRKLFGAEISEAELEERKEIYKRLDTDLSGKSFAGVWKSRGIGIATIIGIASVSDAIHRTALGDKAFDAEGKPRGDIGILAFQNIPPAFGRWKSGMTKEQYEAANNIQTSVAAAKSNYMWQNFAVEFSGTFVTWMAQLAALFSKEVFGVGIDTSIKQENQKPQSHHADAKLDTQPAATKPQGVAIAANKQAVADDAITAQAGANSHEADTRKQQASAKDNTAEIAAKSHRERIEERAVAAAEQATTLAMQGA